MQRQEATAREYHRSMSGGDVVEILPRDTTPVISIPHSWLPQEYQPSTVVSVKVIKDMSPDANGTNGSTAGMSSGWQHEAVNSIRPGTGNVYMQSVSYETANPVQFGNQAQCQSLPVVGGPTQRIQHSTDTAALSEQMMNTTATQKYSQPLPLFRESVLQKFSEELRQQLSQKVANPLSNVQTCVDSLKQTVVKPVAVKAQPSPERFNSLMSSPPHMILSTVASGQVNLPAFHTSPSRGVQDSSSETYFSTINRLQDPSQPSAGNRLLPCNAEMWHPYHPVTQSVSISQSGHFASADRSSAERWYSAVETWPTSDCSTASSYQSQSYVSPQHVVGSPGKLVSPLLQHSPQPQMSPSCNVQAVNLVASRYISARQHAGIASPAKSIPVEQSSHYSRMAPHHVSPKKSASLANTASIIHVSAALPHDHSVPMSRYAPGPRSASGLRKYRIATPIESVLPSARSVPIPNEKQNVINQCPQPNLSMLPPACRAWHLNNTPSQHQAYFQQFARRTEHSKNRLPLPQKNASVTASNTVSRMPSESFTANISPNKFFVHGSLDFDSFIGKPVAVSQKVAKSAVSASSEVSEMVKPKKSSSAARAALKRELGSAETVSRSKNDNQFAVHIPSTVLEATKPTKASSSVCAGVKKKLDSTSTSAATEPLTTESQFANKYLESLSMQGLLGKIEVDLSENKSYEDLPAQKKDSGVCNIYFFIYFQIRSFVTKVCIN